MSGGRRRAAAAMLVPAALLAAALALVFGQLRHPAAVLPLWRPWAEVGALACGMTAIILTGGIDLSVGSIVALCGVVLGALWQDHGWPIGAAAMAAVAVGLIAGALNGTLVAAGVAPLVATLATMALDAGLAMAIAGGGRVAGFPEGFARLGQGDVAGLPAQLGLLLVVAAMAGVLVHGTRLGRYLYAIGDNRTAATFAAVPVRRLEWTLFALNGLLAGVVAVSYTARAGAAVPTAGAGLELQVIACVVLGGTRITGGSGGIGRTLLGLTILAHLEIGLRLLGRLRLRAPWGAATWTLNANGRLVVIGVLLVAVAVLNERLAGPRRAE